MKVFNYLTVTLIATLAHSTSSVLSLPGTDRLQEIGWGKDFEYQSPTPDASRSPCPGLNALANHGALPRDGRKITAEKLIEALTVFMETDNAMASFLAGEALKTGYEENGVQYFDLGSLQTHNAIEHDASLTRKDFALGNNTVLDEALYNQLKSFAFQAKDNKYYMSWRELRDARHLRYDQCKEDSKTGKCDLSLKGASSAWLEAGIAYLEFQNEDGLIPMEWFDVFFKEERFPFELGWKPRGVTFAELGKMAARMRFSPF